MVIYTDDCLIFPWNDSTIDSLLRALLSQYLLEDRGNVSDYLGIRITKDPVTREIHMSQPGLIEFILADLNLLHDSNTKDTPAMGILHPDWQGHPQQDSWNYHSLIGKLNYLAQNTRLDISFVVHQCTHFSNNPIALHEMAVKCIGRYLLQSKGKGLSLTPKHDFSLNMYVDADFAGLWQRDFAELRDYSFVLHRISHNLLWMPNSLGFKTPKWDSTKYYIERVYCSVHGYMQIVTFEMAGSRAT